MNKVKFLKEITETDYKFAGGKARNLSKLMKYGFEVPNGYAIFPECEINKNMNLLLNYFDELKSKYVSVRSSANVEDQKDYSFAGQFDTYLYVQRKDLLKLINKCRAGINNERVTVYCKKNNIDIKKIKITVIVQKMINSDYSGICFTKNPINNSKDELILETIMGLGELIVSGKVTPNNYVVNKRTIDIISESISSQKFQLKYLDNKLREVICYNKILNDDKIKEIASKCIDIERKFEYYADIEWAIEKSKIYILQVRPITT